MPTVPAPGRWETDDQEEPKAILQLHVYLKKRRKKKKKSEKKKMENSRVLL